MSIALKQAPGSLVTPVDDARMYELMSGGQVGIVEGCTVTSLGGNQLKVSAGWGLCLGRQFVVEEETINADVSTSGDVNGRLLIHIDVSNDTPISFVTQAAATLPELTQEDINGSGTIYEIPLATYTVGEISISNLVSVAPTAIDLVSSALARGYIEESGDGYIKYSSGIMQCYGIINFTVAASGASAWGSMYTASTNVTANFAKAFIESPVSITAGVGVNWALLIQATFSYTGVTRIILAADSAASLNGKSFRIYYNAFGRWK